MAQPLDRYKQGMAINQELEIALAWLRSGLAVLQDNRLYHSKHFTFMLLLANGLERLMKIIIMLNAETTTGQFLTRKELRGMSHDLTTLRDEIIVRCFTVNYLPADRDFLMQDPQFQELLNILAVFAQRDRYLYLDSISEPDKLWNPPDRIWEELGRTFFHQARRVELLGSNQIELYRQEENTHFVICLETCIRALTRLFANGVLGSRGKTLALTVQEFADLRDEELGMRNYSL